MSQEITILPVGGLDLFAFAPFVFVKIVLPFNIQEIMKGIADTGRNTSLLQVPGYGIVRIRPQGIGNIIIPVTSLVKA